MSSKPKKQVESKPGPQKVEEKKPAAAPPGEEKKPGAMIGKHSDAHSGKVIFTTKAS